MKIKKILPVILFSLMAFTVSAEKSAKVKTEDLVDGEIKQSELNLENGFGIPAETFSFRVPKNAYALKITISGAEADLDLFVNPGTKTDNLTDAVYKAEEENWNETIFISRQSETPLQSGLYYADVVYQYDFLPRKDGKKLSSVKYSIGIEIIKAEPETFLIPGESVKLTLDPEKGMFAVAAVDIPRGTDSFRIDVFDTNADIDIFASLKSPAKSRDEALYAAESMLGSESLVIGGYSGEKLAYGRYYISLLDQLSHDIPQQLSIIVSLDEEPPAFLKQISPLPESQYGFEAALLSTVEVITEGGKGSGCLVSSAGHIITSRHVIAGSNGQPSDIIYIAVSLHYDLPPVEMFRAEVVAADEKRDLALLKITGGLYGQNLPYGYSFPYFSLSSGKDLRITQPIGIIGYPEVGGTGSRTSITYTSGMISGFERADGYTLIKTDAMISSGNSGGAVINAYYELIGFPSYIMDIDNDRMGYVYPVSAVPSDWLSIINREGR